MYQKTNTCLESTLQETYFYSFNISREHQRLGKQKIFLRVTFGRIHLTITYKRSATIGRVISFHLSTMKVYCVLLLVALPSVLGITDFRQCTNGAPIPDTISIHGCLVSPCTFTEGEPIIANTTVTAREFFFVICIKKKKLSTFSSQNTVQRRWLHISMFS